MNDQISKIEFFKLHSLSGKLSDSFKFINGNFNVLVKLSSYILLPLALFLGLFTIVQNKITDVQMLMSLPKEEFITFLVLCLLGLIVTLFGVSIFASLIYTLIREYQVRDSISFLSLRDIKKPLIANAKKIWILLPVFILIFIIFFVLTGVLAKLSLYTLIVTVPLFFILSIPLAYTGYIYIYEDIKAFPAIWKSYKIGMPTLGSAFAVALFSSIFIFIICVISSMPFLIASIVNNLSIVSVLEGGDVSTLPGYFSILLYVLAVFSIYVHYISQIFFMVAMGLQYFSTTASRAEKLEENQI